jgi:6-pyruvoyltetrahydropterin/6-carboxytetrahydropterin synthase
MIFELKQHFQIESARFLPFLPETHPCRNMHGHSFKIILTLKGKLQPQLGWVQDYHEITQAMDPLLKILDHRVLNEIPGLENPTSELLCYWLFEKCRSQLPNLIRVSISETANTECSYPA